MRATIIAALAAATILTTFTVRAAWTPPDDWVEECCYYDRDGRRVCFPCPPRPL